MSINLSTLSDDAKCYQLMRQTQWPKGVRCPRCESDTVVKNGRDETQPQRQRYQCKSCGCHFDDLSQTIFAGGIELETFVAQKKQNLAVDGGEYQISRHSPVRGGGSLAGDL